MGYPIISYTEQIITENVYIYRTTSGIQASDTIVLTVKNLRDFSRGATRKYKNV